MAIGMAMVTAMPAVAEAAPVAGGFQGVAPVRVLDSPVGAARTITVDMSSRVPATTTAVVLTVTAVNPAKPTALTVYPLGAQRPPVSNLDVAAGETRSAHITVALDRSRRLVMHSSSASVRVTADLAGYYAPEAPGKFTPRTLDQFLDTGNGWDPEPIGPAGTVSVDLSGRVPASTTAVTFNLTGNSATAPTFLTVWPTGTPRPSTANLHLVPGRQTSNLVTVPLGTDRKIDIYNNSGTTDVSGDLEGFYTPEFGALFTPVPPRRVHDATIVPPRETFFELEPTVPASTTAVMVNVTASQAAADTSVVVWPSGFGESMPYSESNLRVTPGQTVANSVAVGVTTRAGVYVQSRSAAVHVTADLAGYFSLRPSVCVENCVYAWGSNGAGALGTGSYNNSSIEPQPVYGLSDVKAVAGRYALRTDGSVWAWGFNGSGELGGGWMGGKSTVPVRVLGLDNVVAIDSGIALRSDGTVWTWGYSITAPEQVPDLTDVVSVAAAFQTWFAVRTDGTVWAWGSNTRGALGVGLPEGKYVPDPVQMPGLTGVRSVAATGLGGLALKNDGTVSSWGTNGEGQLGNGTVGQDCLDLPPTGPNCYSNVAVPVINLTGATSVAASSLNGYASLSDGTAWAWGYDRYGSLGNGQQCDNCRTGTPGLVVDLQNVRKVAANGTGGYALDSSGSVWAWGEHFSGQLGPGVPDGFRTIPVRLPRPSGVTDISGSTFGSGYALVP
jgi:alpha-tubulin suppressor-like RCC1 family protein